LSGHQLLFPANPFTLSATLNAVAAAQWVVTPISPTSTDHWDIVGGDRLISVGQPNSSLQIVTSATIVVELNAGSDTGFCELVITKLQ
jgi:hypothetical protein